MTKREAQRQNCQVTTIDKVVRLGTIEGHGVFCHIQFGPDKLNPGKPGPVLSITGVVGPKRNGNAWGGCGQIHDSLNGLVPGEGWTPELITRFLKTWKAWHMNGMRAACAHQRAEGWDLRPIDRTKPTNTYGRHFVGQKHDSWNMLGWVRPDEHREGLLGKPCEVCGYKYGTSWLFESVPDEVVSFLESLPVSTITPAWV
jgi:hypothetical protein